MRLAIRKELESATESFLVKELREPYFDPNWHFHPHYQLFVVLEGTGTRFIGDSIKPFAAGDLVFLGPNLPHLWRSDAAYFQKENSLETHGIVIYFKEDFLGRAFFGRQEANLIRQLLQHARQGMEWKGETRRQTEQKMKQLLASPPDFERLLQLLHLLHNLSRATEYNSIASVGYTNTVTSEETQRMQLVHEYVLSHFQEKIQLDTVADLVGMTASAFCRYFKARSNKTFTDFVTEVRIGHACKLLMENRLNVSQISYECGFGTLSHFNNQFREITGNTPLNYRKAHQ